MWYRGPTSKAVIGAFTLTYMHMHTFPHIYTSHTHAKMEKWKAKLYKVISTVASTQSLSINLTCYSCHNDSIMTTTLMKETNEYHFAQEGYLEDHCKVLPFDLGIVLNKSYALPIGCFVLSVNRVKINIIGRSNTHPELLLRCDSFYGMWIKSVKGYI